jgi:hypothetical protein
MQPSMWIVPILRRGWGQWGLLGGSATGRGSTRGKPSKLASLARSSRGAFDKSASTPSPSTRLGSVSRLAALSSRSQSVTPVPSPSPRPPSPLRPQLDDPVLPEASPKQTAPDPIPTHLLSTPSLLADSLYYLSLIPRQATASLCNLQANPYLLIGSTKAQVQKAFSNPSPDDIVQKAQSKTKRKLSCRVSDV